MLLRVKFDVIWKVDEKLKFDSHALKSILLFLFESNVYYSEYKRGQKKKCLFIIKPTTSSSSSSAKQLRGTEQMVTKLKTNSFQINFYIKHCC